MAATLNELPDSAALAAGLEAVFRAAGYDGVAPVDRRPNPHASTFPSEIVTCRLAGGLVLRVLLKYAADHIRHVLGHRGGVSYEAAVYRGLLRPSRMTAPRCYGIHDDPDRGETWLVLEYLDSSVRVKSAVDPAAMSLAARWIGRFHALHEGASAASSLPELIVYDAAYYVGWARRTAQFAGHWHRRLPWLERMCDRFEEVIPTLLGATQTVIHGEYFPSNVLFRDGVVYPIDWESAAAACGEIDLACLIEDWPEETAASCTREYHAARWPSGPPGDFGRRLEAARLYLQFRWLGNRPEWTVREDRLWRFEQVRSLGERLGLMGEGGPR